MKQILLVADPRGDSNTMVARAAEIMRYGVSEVSDSRSAFKLLRRGAHGIDLLIIDADSDVHPMAILGALSGCKGFPPIIVLTGFEEYDMTPIAHRHGATACIGKPFSTDELVALIERVCPRVDGPDSWSSDQWGHPHRCHHEITRKCASDCKHHGCGATTKFSAIPAN